MKWILIGHRGVGKSELLKRLKSYSANSQIKFFDLDSEIEKASGKSISEIFKTSGEAEFRKLELKVLSELSKQQNSIIAAGAGLELEKAQHQNPECKFIWVRRETDKLGRIFVDRPRLDSNVSRLDEYDQRFRTREKRYSIFCDVIYEMPEGLDSENSFEKAFFFENPEVDAIVTVQDFEKLNNLQQFVKFKDLEFRSDLNGKQLFKKASSQNMQGKLIYSFRNADDSKKDESIKHTNLRYDWALELGALPPWFQESLSNIVSLHSKGDFSNYEKKFHLKYSPIVESFTELYSGFVWQQTDPDNRSFLPRSLDGSWMWFRLFMKGRQKINFVSSGVRSAKDQPTIFQWMSTKPKAKFAAVLGKPVSHSRSPLEHQEFFLKRNLNFFSIEVSADSFYEDFKILEKLGLQAAAVTSPHKKKAFELAQFQSAESTQFQSANTLVLNEDKWHCHNTDSEGFLKSVSTVNKDTHFLIWGGGGTLGMLKAAFPRGVFLSASTGEARDFSQKLPKNFRELKWVLIWAAEPTSDFPEEFTFESVIDLNYTEYSKARDVAAIQKVPYISGVSFFKAQAQLQREFWNAKLKK